MYLVKWFNFPDSANSWESAKEFENDIVKRFWADVLRTATERIELMEKTGEPNPREYGTGKRFTPSDKWLERQSHNAAEANAMPETSPKKARAKRR
ncbi:hypothetical protein EXIGLDRAFT_845234 [Exidia glandulosa HHB12029]|uniref:Chromo domain-containing protein n=1 Tax=Exidia glandulosa HHB12029 TaxID=1314781 RepID=A0A165BKJ8_EXIGL|nr:hypothetical protein EXIGLDRAFT_845234 [Exidia glandulosa HHB12029]